MKIGQPATSSNVRAAGNVSTKTKPKSVKSAAGDAAHFAARRVSVRIAGDEG
jgi:hypothetical protein